MKTVWETETFLRRTAVICLYLIPEQFPSSSSRLAPVWETRSALLMQQPRPFSRNLWMLPTSWRSSGKLGENPLGNRDHDIGPYNKKSPACEYQKAKTKSGAGANLCASTDLGQDSFRFG